MDARKVRIKTSVATGFLVRDVFFLVGILGRDCLDSGFLVSFNHSFVGGLDLDFGLWTRLVFFEFPSFDRLELQNYVRTLELLFCFRSFSKATVHVPASAVSPASICVYMSSLWYTVLSLVLERLCSFARIPLSFVSVHALFL